MGKLSKMLLKYQGGKDFVHVQDGIAINDRCTQSDFISVFRYKGIGMRLGREEGCQL